MDSPGTQIPCTDCATPTPRGEMFGAAPDLRCPACADRLRTRLHPSQVRRGSARVPTGSGGPTGRVTAVLLGLLVALWALLQVESLSGPWMALLLDAPKHVHRAPPGFSWHPHPWQLALWSLQHFEFWHLAMNGFTLFQFGRWIEWGFGVRLYLLVLLGSALAGTAAGWLVNGAPTIGISGGLFGLIGWLLALRRHHPMAAAMVTRHFLHSLLAYVVLTVALTQFGNMRISHVAHGVGFLWGLAAGRAARSSAAALGLGLLCLATVVLLNLPTFVAPLKWGF